MPRGYATGSFRLEPDGSSASRIRTWSSQLQRLSCCRYTKADRAPQVCRSRRADPALRAIHGKTRYACTVASVAPAPLSRPAVARPRAVRVALPALLGLLGAVIAGVHVDSPTIWRDEAASITMAQRDWPAFFGTIAHVDAVHALYYAGLHLWFAVVPYSPFTLRLPSVLAAGATAAVLTVLASRLAGLRAGIAAGAAAAVLPSLVWAGGEGRSYALTALLASATTLALVVALDERRSRRRSAVVWAGYAALLALTTALFVDAVLLGIAHLVTLLVVGHRKRLGGIAAIAVATVAVSPLLVLAARQSGQVAWIAIYGSPPLWTDGIEQQWFRSVPVMTGWAAVLAIGALVAVLRRRLPLTALAIAVPWAILPPVALVAISLVHTPVYWPRYVTFTAPAVALLIGVVVAAMPAPLTGVALLVLAALAAPQVQADRLPRAKAESEMALAARLVAGSRSAADGAAGIVFGQYDHIEGLTTRLEAVAYPDAFAGLTDLTARVPLRRSTELFGADLPTTAAVPRAARLNTVWILLDLDAVPKTFVPAAALRAAGFHESGRFRTTGSLLLRWSR